jgi:hypothetical protein
MQNPGRSFPRLTLIYKKERLSRLEQQRALKNLRTLARAHQLCVTKAELTLWGLCAYVISSLDL